MRLTLIAEAKADARDAASWYDSQAGLGDAFINELVLVFGLIERAPTRFPRVERLRLPVEVRRARLDRFPYAVVFQVLDDRIRVIAITHTARKPGHWRGRVKGGNEV